MRDPWRLIMKKILFSVAAAALMSTSAFAATDGSPGVNSTGNADINVTIDPFVSISGLDDLTINIAASNINSSAPNNRAGEDVTYFCVFSNVTAAGTYTITATSEYEGSEGNPFGLRGPQETQLNYMASFRDQGTGSPFVSGGSLARNQARQATTTAGNQNRPTDFNCSNVTGGSNAAIGIGVRNSVALAALAGTYTGTLTVTVAVP
jgi:hypothetical protein